MHNEIVLVKYETMKSNELKREGERTRDKPDKTGREANDRALVQ
jgi:hypothetical protein